MANTKSALKEIRKNNRRRTRNRLVRSSTRTMVKRASRAIETNDPQTEAELREAFRSLDKAAQKGVIHKNAASRRKARLTKKFKSRASA